MRNHTHSLTGAAAHLPLDPPSQVISISPIVLPCPDRQVDLELRISVPSPGDGPWPIALVSHGHGPSNHLSSHDGYAPLADFLAAQGFAVIQPTHLSSRSIGITIDAENIRDLFMDSRARDMTRILDRIDEIEDAVPSILKGRLDRSKVVVLGHSLGGMTASVLLGATNTDPRDGTVSVLGDKRITAGVIFGGTGAGGDALVESGKALFSFYDIDFGQMRTPALVVCGEEDDNPRFTHLGAEWHAHPYSLAPGPKELFMVRGGKHGFGGISGWDADETEDESPERLGAVLRMAVAYLKSRLDEGDMSWSRACEALKGVGQLGWVESK
jgi:predicted dienelactone hydrolase